MAQTVSLIGLPVFVLMLQIAHTSRLKSALVAIGISLSWALSEHPYNRHVNGKESEHVVSHMKKNEFALDKEKTSCFCAVWFTHPFALGLFEMSHNATYLLVEQLRVSK